MWFPTALLLLGTYLFCSVDLHGAEDSSGERPAAALLLRNGEVLRGRPTRRNDRFVVRMEGGGEVRVPVADVKFFGHDLHDVYLHQRGQVADDDADSLLDLAQWCLLHRLLREGAHCLLDAAEVDPHHPDLEQLEQRLYRAARLCPSRSLPVQTNTANKQSDRLPPVVELPADMIAEFTKTIQPILLNCCATAGCHRTSSRSAYQLQLPPLRGPMPQATTLFNLRATLLWVDAARPKESQLLLAAQRPHGTGGAAIAIQQQPYRYLAEWVERLGELSADPLPPDSSLPPEPVAQATPAAAFAKSRSAARQETGESPRAAEQSNGSPRE